MKLLIAGLLVAASVCVAENIKITIPSNMAPAFVLTVPPSAKVTSKSDKTEIKTPDMTLYIWVIPTAQTVTEGVAQITNVIASQVVQFVATTTNTISVAGAAAQHLVGRAVEADDYDPGTADVVVFTAGKTVFAACVHGEGNEAVRERKPMLAVLATAQAP